MTEHRTKEGTETIEQAARRLLAKMNARKRPAGEKPAEIQSPTERPEVEKEADEVAAVSAYLVGRVARPWGGRRGLVASNDNGRAGFHSDYPMKGMLTVTARPGPDDSVRYRSRGFALLKLRAPGDWEF